jgi:hypothetical protein
MNIYLIIRLGGSLTNLALFVFSLRAFWIHCPRFVKIFTVLCFLEVLADVIEWLARQSNLKQIASLCLNITELAVYTYIFLQIIRSRLVRGIFIGLISVLSVLYLRAFLRQGVFSPALVEMEVLDYLVFLIPSFAYFKEIFTFQKEGNLLKDFTFWFVTASLFIFASTIVTTLGMYYMYGKNLGNYGNNFYLFSGIVFMIVNILYIKAYRCLRK